MSIGKVVVFNLAKGDQKKMEENLPKHFNLELKIYPAEKTSQKRSCIDLAFSKYMHLICELYVSYFFIITLYSTTFFCNLYKKFNICDSFVFVTNAFRYKKFACLFTFLPKLGPFHINTSGVV